LYRPGPDAVGEFTARFSGTGADYPIGIQNRAETRIRINHDALLFSLPNGAGVVMQGMGAAVDLGAVQGDPIGGDLQVAGAGEALISQHELGVTGRAEQVGGSLEDPITAGVGDVELLAIDHDAGGLIVGGVIHGRDQGDATETEQTDAAVIQVQIGVADVLGVDGGVLGDLVQVSGGGVGLVSEPTGKDLAGGGLVGHLVTDAGTGGNGKLVGLGRIHHGDVDILHSGLRLIDQHAGTEGQRGLGADVFNVLVHRLNPLSGIRVLGGIMLILLEGVGTAADTLDMDAVQGDPVGLVGDGHLILEVRKFVAQQAMI